MSNTDTQIEANQSIKLDKFKYIIEIIKWIIGSVVLVTLTIIIDKGFKERTAGIQEMQAFDKYVEIILKADNIQERWKLSEFFSTVTPTERLRERWTKYKSDISADYETFKKLKNKEDSLKVLAILYKSPEAINNLNKVRKQLEPYEKKLIAPSTPINDNSKILDTPQNNIQPQNSMSQPSKVEVDNTIKKFKEEQKKDATTDNRFQFDEYFKKVNEVNNSVVLELSKELGEPYQSIQTNMNYNYKDGIFTNQYGIQSKFDNNKSIWPVLNAKYINNSFVITMSEKGSTESINLNSKDVVWEDLRLFIKNFFIKRLGQLK
jgi:hypothetical protein